MTRIQLRRGNQAAWEAANPILAAGEVGLELDTGRWKIGDGSKTWMQLTAVIPTWATISGKPAVVAAGATQADARNAIGAVTLGSTSSTAKPGDYTPSQAEVLAALGFTPADSATVGQANGVASLDSAGKVPVTQLTVSAMEYKGTWSASANTPTLADGTGNAGDVYRVSVAGSRNLGSGSIQFRVGDSVIYNGSVWQRSATGDNVASVAGLQGDVTDTALKTALAISTSDVSGLAAALAAKSVSDNFDGTATAST